MIIGEILQLIGVFFEKLLAMIGLSSGITAVGPNTLRVFIKYSGKTVQVDLDPSWTVKKVKDIVAPKLNSSPEEIKIIFAGTELPDNFVLQVFEKFKCKLSGNFIVLMVSMLNIYFADSVLRCGTTKLPSCCSCSNSNTK